MLSIGDFARLGRVSPRMLRHYDQIGLLRPDHVDAVTGYRSYGVAQLARLHRVMALRELGFGLDQISAMVGDELSIDQLRGMLRLRQAQIEQNVADEQTRLLRVEAHLRALERNTTMDTIDIVVKQTDPLRIAEASDTAAGFGPPLEAVFGRLYPAVVAHLATAGARPGLCVAYYDEPADDGSVVVHAGFDIGDQPVPDGDEVHIVELPVTEVASVLHHGSMRDVESVYEALVGWIEDSGHRLAGRSRELYLESHPDNPSANVTELQMPITK